MQQTRKFHLGIGAHLFMSYLLTLKHTGTYYSLKEKRLELTVSLLVVPEHNIMLYGVKPLPMAV